ncbi:MAG: glycosyltransferase family 4 protein [Myxococcales bacterium]|nr:glycosyltransferase family 4 protein [Myxococcales bacterium]
MRVLHVVDGRIPELDCWPSMRARRVIEMSSSLGFEPLVLSTRDPARDGPALSVDPIDGVSVERVPFLKERSSDTWADRGFAFHRIRGRVRRMVVREKAQVVHVYGRPLVAFAALTGARQANVAVIWEPWIVADHGTRASWGWTSFDAIVTPSRAHANTWANLVRRDDRVHYLPDGIELRRLRDFVEPPSTLRLVLAPLIDGAPDLRLLLRCLTAHPELRTQVHITVFLAAHREALLKDGLLTSDQVSSSPPTFEALSRALESSLALLVLAENQQGPSFEALEAAAVGRPILGPKHAGLAELVRDGHTGLLFEPGDEDALATSLERLISVARDYGRALRNEAIRSRPWPVIVEGYFEVYDRAVRETGAGGALHRITDRWERLKNPGLRWR